MPGRLVLVCLLLPGMLVLGACSSSSRDDTKATATASLPPIVASATVALPTATGSAATTPTSTPATTPGPRVNSVRELDFRSPPLLGELLSLAGGGEVQPDGVRYVDLTGDGVEEAVVTISSGGTQGDIGVAVYRVVGGMARRDFFQKLAGRVEVRGDSIVVTDGVYERGDAACCPSRLQETVYGWTGSGFAERSSRVFPNPGAGR